VSNSGDKPAPHAFKGGEIFYYYNGTYGVVLMLGGRGTHSDYNKYTIYRITKKSEQSSTGVSYHNEERLMDKVVHAPWFTRLRLRWFHYRWINTEWRRMLDD